MALVLNGSTGITSPGGDTSTSLSTGLLTVTGSTVPANGMYLPTTNTLAWATNSTERLRLDASGNLGLGVTPSGANLPTIQSTYGLFTGSSEAHIARNAYYNSGWTYVTSSTATRFSQAGGQHQWYTAASGTAGNAISFTQAMTLDASGNLVVGGTDASYAKVSVRNGYFYVNEDGANTRQIYIRSGVGATPTPAIQVATADPLAFWTNNLERARIDSSGNFLVGTTSGTNPGGIIQAKSTAANMQCFGAWNAVDSGQAYLFYGGTGSTWTARYQIYWNFTGGTGTAGFLSDYRQKDNVRKLTGGLDAVNALKPSIYRFKDAIQDASGFIAHEVQEVIPQAVSGHKDEVDEDGEPKYQMLDQTHIIPYLTAAIQELTARLEALEGAK